MILSDISVKHPVFAIVISLLLIAFGLIALNRLALREYPDVNPPIVSVETSYPGASAHTVASRITRLLENRISGIEGIRYIEAKSKDGLSVINIEFNINRNIDHAANDVRDRIARVTDDLPEAADPPQIFKVDSNNNAIMWLNLTSPQMNALQLTDYAQRYIVDQLSIANGVARIRIGGEKRYAMRIWLDRKKMAAHHMTTLDIEKALRAENVELPGGRVESKQRELTVRLKRNYQTAQDFIKLPIGRGSNNHVIRLGDVANVKVGAENPRTELRGNQQGMIGLGVIKQSTANTLQVAREIKQEIKRIQATLPAKMQIIQSYDSALFIEAAVHEVYKTLAIAMILVILIIYLFLGNIRAMLIPAVTVPISLIASFIILYAFHFSINLLTLLALVLAIGLVVDDAIVVLENISRRITQLKEPPLLASYRGTRQVGFAVIATTLVLLAVFMPIALLQGQIGRLFTEFAFTLAAAVTFSSIVALTLSPVMCANMLSATNQPNKLTEFTQNSLKKITVYYKKSLTHCLRYPKFMSGLFLLCCAATAFLFHLVPEEYVPAEDRGAFFVIAEGPEGASFQYTQQQMRAIEKVLMPLVDKGQAKRVLTIAPRGFGSSDAVNSGFGIVVMQPWNKRKITTQQAMHQVSQPLQEIAGLRAIPVMRQPLGARGIGQKVQFVLGGSDYKMLARWRDVLISAMQQNKGFENIDSDYKPTRPEILVDIQRQRALKLGVPIHDIGKTLETLLGSRKITTYINNDEEYEVMLEESKQSKRTLSDLNNLYVRSTTTQKLIPLSNLVEFSEKASPANLNRFNRLRAITINASLQPGYTLGQALAYLEKISQQKLPKNIKIDYKGRSRDYKEASHAIYFTFTLALIVMSLILAAQFGSFIHPLVILVTAPLAVLGALFGLFIAHNTLNIYSQIGMIMLVGLAAKNGILMVEFINQLRDQEIHFIKAIIEGSATRLRPVLMTAISTLFGAIPLILATGAGANSRISIGLVIFFGVLFASALTLYIIPTAYQLLARNTLSRLATARKLKKLLV